MSRKASQAKPSSPWSLTSRPLSSGPERPSPRRGSNPPVSPLSVDSFKSAEASPILSERSLTPIIKSPATAKDGTASNFLALIGPVASPITPRNTVQHDYSAVGSVEGGTTDDSSEPVLPMTPKSQGARSPATDTAPLTTEEAPFEKDPTVRRDLEVVDELLGTMRQMLGTLSSTVDTLGEQTIKVATLPAAMAAVHQIASAKDQLDAHQKQQEENMMAFKQLLLDEVRTRLYTRLKDTASAIVQEIIQKEIAERVRKQLRMQIPQSMRDEVLRYKHQIMEVQVSLRNSEARRHNALIRTNSPEEPLRPLLRPPPSLEELFARDTLQADGHRKSSGIGDSDKRSASAASPSTRRHKASSVSSTVQGRRARLSALDLDIPTPSPLFPRDLTALARLNTDETRELMRDYGLVKTRRVARRVLRKRKISLDDPFLDKPETTFGDETETETSEVVELVEEDELRDETVNRFLQFIGVGSVVSVRSS
ncbi:uncharacterized protein PHACADRAFT_259872 [Phanerochaete carnosa HHB-10118-sp]|uniref:Uncharacterized protein n=1 Tax=Phanerochaete carnosa (strain HHB-10118-sp) TaxID=650164 RepID=K5VPT2_PHACS|nr:uncharacterized protein PHACADRAFT_259872 [Phanerochaete carnosa HHB-10118-sp]EKM53463.1 hypothetical protein PHACADRAFT_259872 [Phanerochaete carnosa HHB-10118-sp]